MNLPALPNAQTFDKWLDEGRGLGKAKQHLGFMIGDWVHRGREQFPDQIEMALEQTGLDRRFIRKAERVALAFPPHMRSTKLSFEDHQEVLSLPEQERLPLLQKAESAGWRNRQIKDAAIQKRYEIGDDFRDEDRDWYLYLEWKRCFNRLTDGAKKLAVEAMQAMTENGQDEIE